MKIEQCLGFLKHPDSDEPAEFMINNDIIADAQSGRQYPIIHGMIDFTGIDIPQADNRQDRQGLLFTLNTLFSRYLDAKILTSVFAGGGIGFSRAKKKMKVWLAQSAKQKILFLEPENKSLLSHIGKDNCVTIEDLASKNVLPAKEHYPDINARMEKIPIRSNAFQAVLSYFVVEHVKDPRDHIKELARILKPGGYLILGGPGDVYPSHRVPYNYFNVIRFGYYEMFKENNLELIEEYYPAKSWVSILYLAYTTAVRNSFFNKNQFTKLLQLMIFLISMAICPILNGIALLLDQMTPFDKRIYILYLALVRKKQE
ncbi:MAG: SAM-dependent methyltransferase [Desulfobacteraceae bacterium]|nr:MAG: SAM-dependent methyltransferase [Desulfobacteraceae bacterium]